MRKEYCYDYPRPALTVDIVVFRNMRGHTEVLLIRREKDPYEGRWAFPGGYVEEMEALETAAARELAEETGLRDLSLEQIGAFGAPGRDPRGHTVSVAFAGRLETDQEIRASDDAADARWFALGDIPDLAFDHNEMLAFATRVMLHEDESGDSGRAGGPKTLH